MRKRIFVVVISALILSLALGGIAIFAAEQLKRENVYPQLELFSNALTLIQKGYVEEVSIHDLIYGALQGMLTSLDPHSQFLDPEAFKELKVETEGQFGGLGIEITIKDNLLTIITPIEDTPAWKAGIMAGDRIVKIDDEPTRDITLSEAVKKLRGKPGTEVNLTVLRESENRILDISIVRDIIKIKDVKKAVILEENIGYIRLIEFRENSAKEFEAALRKLQKQGMEGLILDVRYNPGGLLDVAIDITSNFLAYDSVVVSTQGRNPDSKIELKSRKKKPILDLPLVVLINEGSASGSEILAGALQDQQRAIIMGMKSFGKASVQTVIPMSDGSALRLTTCKYFTPSGRSIHEVGIAPDIEVKPQIIAETETEEVEDVFKRLEEEENEDKQLDEVKQEVKEEEDFYLRDSQLLRALDLLKAIKVYDKKAQELS